MMHHMSKYSERRKVQVPGPVLLHQLKHRAYSEMLSKWAQRLDTRYDLCQDMEDKQSEVELFSTLVVLVAALFQSRCWRPSRASRSASTTTSLTAFLKHPTDSDVLLC